jgi:apolipoprotein N-acyltransferase
MKFPDKENIVFVGIVVAIIFVFFFYILGFSGAMSAIGIILIFIIPTYLILNNFELDNDEKIIFSFFIGVGVFPSLTYWLATFISFKVSILITFLIFLAAGFLVKRFWKR